MTTAKPVKLSMPGTGPVEFPSRRACLRETGLTEHELWNFEKHNRVPNLNAERREKLIAAIERRHRESRWDAESAARKARHDQHPAAAAIALAITVCRAVAAETHEAVVGWELDPDTFEDSRGEAGRTLDDALEVIPTLSAAVRLAGFPEDAMAAVKESLERARGELKKATEADEFDETGLDRRLAMKLMADAAANAVPLALAAASDLAIRREDQGRRWREAQATVDDALEDGPVDQDGWSRILKAAATWPGPGREESFHEGWVVSDG